MAQRDLARVTHEHVEAERADADDDAGGEHVAVGRLEVEDVVEADRADDDDEGGATEPSERGRRDARVLVREDVSGDRGLEVDRH